VFARQVVTDFLNLDGLDDGEFALVDIDPQRLELAHQITEKIIAVTGTRWRVSASIERRELLPGSDCIVNTVEVAGLANVRYDFEIPLKYGIDQCVGDTIGPGGIFKALRAGPAWTEGVRYGCTGARRFAGQ
jgi:alpha-galactosidase